MVCHRQTIRTGGSGFKNSWSSPNAAFGARTTHPVPGSRLEDQDLRRKVRIPTGIGVSDHKPHREATGPAAGSANKNGREETFRLLEML